MEKEELKFYTINGWYSSEEVAPIARTYSSNHNLAIQLVCADGEPYATLTVNFDALDDPTLAYVDTNNVPEAERFIVDNDLGYHIDQYKASGWCMYPLFKFNLEKLNFIK